MGKQKQKKKIKYKEKQYNIDTMISGLRNIFGLTEQEKYEQLIRSRKTFISKIKE